MHAALVLARLTASQKDFRDVGRATKRPENVAAYLSGLTTQQMLYAEAVWWRDQKAEEKLFANTLRAVLSGWKSIGAPPKDRAAYDRWREKNAKLAQIMTRAAVNESVDPRSYFPNRPAQLSAAIGVSERQWYREYQDRYNAVLAYLDALNDGAMSRIHRNQIEVA